MKRATAVVLLAVAYALAIFLGSSLSQPELFLPSALLSSDKAIHAVEYAVLGGLLAVAFRLRGRSAPRSFAWALLLASAYGVSDEIHQYFVPGRSCDPLDWVADTTGAAVGALVALAALRWWGSRASILR